MSYRYRASPAATQVEGLALHCQHARYVWNLACEQQSYYRVAGRVSRPPNSAARFRQLAVTGSRTGRTGGRRGARRAGTRAAASATSTSVG